MKLYSPTLVYLMFSVSKIIIDVYNKVYEEALMKMLVTVLISILLNILCERGFETVAWMIVFIPFLLMSIIVGILIYYFGLNTQTGEINYNDQIKKDVNGDIIIYYPNYNARERAAYYSPPNLIVPNPETK